MFFKVNVWQIKICLNDNICILLLFILLIFLILEIIYYIMQYLLLNFRLNHILQHWHYLIYVQVKKYLKISISILTMTI